MALDYILKQLGFKTGLNPQDPSQRSVLLRYANEAAVELYNISDMFNCLEEQVFMIRANQTLALPDYVGDIRAMREQYSHIAIKLSQMRPRYNQFNWADNWRNWRLKGIHPLQTTLTNYSSLTIAVKEVENPPVVVTLTGPTTGSSNTVEVITLSSASVTTVNYFSDITSFTKSGVNQFDVILSDIDGNQLSYIANNKTKAQFQIVDISGAPWYPTAMGPLFGWVEVLYKRSLPWYSNDSDEFPAQGYDNVWVNKCLQLYYEEQKDIQTAMAYSQKVISVLAQIHENANRATDDVVNMTEHPHDVMHHRTGFGRDWRFAYRITGR